MQALNQEWQSSILQAFSWQNNCDAGEDKA